MSFGFGRVEATSVIHAGSSGEHFLDRPEDSCDVASMTLPPASFSRVAPVRQPPPPQAVVAPTEQPGRRESEPNQEGEPSSTPEPDATGESQTEPTRRKSRRERAGKPPIAVRWKLLGEGSGAGRLGSAIFDWGSF
ncbi:MAG: hypothetical protein PVG79_03080 [Gemmatimonadales bacterium]